MAKRLSKAFAALLLILMATVSVAGHEGTLMVALAARTAGCHQHGAEPPAPKPVSYRCCQSGHDSAILPTSLAAQPSLALVSTGISIPTLITVSTEGCLRSLTISSSDPPHTIPLRV